MSAAHQPSRRAAFSRFSGFLSRFAAGTLLLRFPVFAQTHAESERGFSSIGSIASGTTTSSATPQVIAVRVWAATEYTRVTIESNGPLQTTQTLVAAAQPLPHRLAIDLHGIVLNDSLKALVAKVLPDDPFIASVRVAQYAPSIVRLVFDLKQAVLPQVFSLPPVPGLYQERLVLDLYPEQAPDPIAQLMAQIASPLQDPAPRAMKPSKPLLPPSPSSLPLPDPLGDLIAQNPARSAEHVKPTPTTSAQRLVLIALDPGHGGEDPGAIGPSGMREKDVVLAIAKRLQARLNSESAAHKVLGHKGLSSLSFKAFLTREADYFVPLAARVEKAHRTNADLFLSIHADAFTTPTARGASVFALSQKGASSLSARWLANQENRSDAIGGMRWIRKDKSITQTLLDMGTSAQIKDSLQVGKAVLSEIGQVGTLHKPSVEQAAFAVLKSPQIPSVLVETAFISNPQEELRLGDAAYQERIAQALQRGIYAYFAKHPPLARRLA